jgi:hypothetical protein
VVEVAGFSMTPLLATIVAGIGVLLLAAAASASRALSTFVGGVMVIAGLIVAFAVEELPEELVTEESFGWLVAIIGALIVLVDMLVPTMGRRDRTVRTTV